MHARFKAEDTFGIKGRGTVIAGFVIEGEFKVGMMAAVPGFPRQLKIHGIERFTMKPPRAGRIGLFFGDLNSTETRLLQSLALKDKTIEIEEMSPEK